VRSVKQQHGPASVHTTGAEREQDGYDPKDGELCLTRAKPEETLVEARRDSDVQIDLHSWV